MMNFVSFETPPLGRQERVDASTTIRAKEASSRDTCFNSHLDLSLGISLSPGGSSSHAAGCSTAKTSYGGCQGSRSDNLGGTSSGIATTTISANVLNTRHGHGSDMTAGSGWTAVAAAFMLSPTGFMHPWSLAARQQKAAAEQDRTPAAAYVPRDARAVPLPSAIGWPPVHASRRNLVTSTVIAKPGTTTVVNGPKGTTLLASGENKVVEPTGSTVMETRPQANMFAKVHMDGYAIGRKINLRAHGSYDSLSRILTKMTRNFFCPMDCSGANMGEEDFSISDKFIFLYEDFEGDRMLVISSIC
ncbi:auxin-responsive protein IAA27-like isoform X2 [Phragmites australis]|uniref:auxin-responsive protein IAA27-like isoform X2 n=1 Tax=Phragmites australis TaxID=29695 RepID=UPI002D77E33D|nr:auxin-responsive protein IAA27-like isoform X2 [Phragmites australis]